MDTLSPPEPASAPVEPAAQPTSLWEDLVDVFVAPGELFARRGDGRYGAALLVLSLVSAFLMYAAMRTLTVAFDAEFERQMAGAVARGGQQPSAEQLSQMQSMGQTFGALGVLVSTPITAFVLGAVIWLWGKMMGSALGYRVGVAIATYSSFPMILGMVAMLLQGILGTPETLSAASVGPARFLDPDTTSAVVLALLMRLELFGLWGAALVGVGLRVAGRLTVAEAAMGAVVAWAVASLPMVLPALL